MTEIYVYWISMSLLLLRYLASALLYIFKTEWVKKTLARFGSPEEDIAPVVLFLASKDAQFITGYNLSPDGGTIIDSGR
ncbi:SDR family oxidoreductase [Herbaspirillum sp. alder98]|uniref:SDR family oxidoreductase n=1 Tax=Herbaspirillum sp. alder98 TaxID=2913096 RepID=UPI001CD8AA6C|nr:SDR family oxidoreductase [Herbaspirillum sp. alder98]MCA1325368.1 SDR family oxidoreductase [Herbaspirillum sp. alder98]